MAYPRDLGYRMPAEWEPHQRTLVSWPVKPSMVYPEDYDAVCRGYAGIIETAARFEPVTVIVNPAQEDAARAYINSSRVDYLPVPHNDSWLRDNGPTFVVDRWGELAGINWSFNAWGGKYRHWDLDDLVASAILDHYRLPIFDAPLVMEGGSIHTDGQGSLLTTAQCLLNPNRNPGLSQADIEGYLGSYLGAEKVIWLQQGLSGDETDGHVDNVACFAAPGQVLIQVCQDPAREDYLISQENLEILQETVDARGRRVRIIPLPAPPPRSYQGISLTLSYLNFYFVNGGLILPVFGGDAAETDRQAQQVLAATFPGRHICTVDGMAIIREGGNVHCMTQQMPAGIGGGE